ncbi:hypothetical protein BB987_05380 [Photorhabdus temperata]|nr:hypothetical protein BB987_05380 [Photorhabdus temperata]
MFLSHQAIYLLIYENQIKGVTNENRSGLPVNLIVNDITVMKKGKNRTTESVKIKSGYELTFVKGKTR